MTTETVLVTLAITVVSGLVTVVLRDIDRRLSAVERKQETGDQAIKPLSESVIKLTVLVDQLQKAVNRLTGADSEGE